jgi:predicted nucleotidyltransferase
MTQRIAFANLTIEDLPVDFGFTGCPGYEIDHTRRPGQITLWISGKMENGEMFDTNLDLELPLARTVAAALIALADWVERTDTAYKGDTDAE